MSYLNLFFMVLKGDRMKKQLIRIIYIFLLAMCVTSCKKLNEKIYLPGVSVELAKYRKEHIENLGYELFFDIPLEKSEQIKGNITISFNLKSPQEIIIDFRESQDNILSVIANDMPTEYTFRNDHIIIPRSSLQKNNNHIYIEFIAGEQSLNRNDEFLYTLFVPDRARTVFPCFEQPNLKALFTLSMRLPTCWEAVSNTNILNEKQENDRKLVQFAQTEPLSTYLFSFVAGKLKRVDYSSEKRVLTAYHRETDPKRIAQLNNIFHEVEVSLDWLEEYTNVPYPFAKYSLIILPGFQYGGMEHTGATLYNDNVLFLGEHPSIDERLARAKLIAHETAHMWFGDYVTMNWFDDVWIKEVFANYFAARMTEPLFLNINHKIASLKNYAEPSMSEDRTQGGTAIKQQLDNLANAGLIYNQIIYNKAPLVMEKLVEIMGEEAFREGIQEYLQSYAYSNATWEELIQILDKKSDKDLKQFSKVWITERGMPTIKFTQENGVLKIEQKDPYERGLSWPQSFNIVFKGESDTVQEVTLTDATLTMPLPEGAKYVLPNSDGRGYGRFVPDSTSMNWIIENWKDIEDETTRLSLLMILYENYVIKRISTNDWLRFVLDAIDSEQNELIASSLVGYIGEPLRKTEGAERDILEKEILAKQRTHHLSSCRQQLLRSIMQNMTSPYVISEIHNIWKGQTVPLLNENDYTNMAYELAIRLPKENEAILHMQRERISNPDRLRQFDFISRAVTLDTLKADVLFNELLLPENRRIEPWTASALAYLNHRQRGEYAVKYIRTALEELKEIQRTGDIFFPSNWVNALLRHHDSEKAKREVERFLQDYPDYPQLLKSKILQSCFHLQNM